MSKLSRRLARRRSHWLVLLSTLLLWPSALAAQAPGGRLVISHSDVSSAPTVLLRAYGMDAQGAPIQFNSQNIQITHNGQPVSNAEVIGTHPAGTLTVFLIDLAPGLDDQLPAIQAAIQQYAASPNMQERVDYLAIYRVGETAAAEMLAPTHFYNAIINFFTDPLEVQTSPTALVDSLGLLLDQVEGMKPAPEMVASVVVITDGTDAVSTQFQPEELAGKAAGLWIPVHTIWVQNAQLQAAGHEAGRAYLDELAAGSRGLAARLDDPAAVQAIWDRINAFRDHHLIQYASSSAAGGQQQVVLSLSADPSVQASTEVNIPATAPSVTLNLPAEQRELTLESPGQIVELPLAAAVSWLDGQERQVATADLVVNGVVVQQLDVERLDEFTAQIGNLNVGSNTLQVAVVDELGQRATSPIVRLSVSQGPATTPPEQAPTQGGGALLPLIVAAALLLAAIGVVSWRLMRARREAAEMNGEAPSAAREPGKGAPRPAAAVAGRQTSTEPKEAYLEVLQAATRVPRAMRLSHGEHRLGRSPAQADLLFENDVTVSRLHAGIILEGSDYRLYDLGSTSGTFVNDQPVPEYGHLLADGDEIRVGDVWLRYRQLTPPA
jgi:hypothetical protein